MNWYYAVSGKQLGPVNAAELEQLHAAGEITDGTLVWREGMGAWQSYRTAMASLPAAPAPDALVAGSAVHGWPDDAPGGRCIECGREYQRREVLPLPAGPCCHGCKARVLQKMREGVAVGPMEELRRRFFTREVSIRSVGAVCCLGAALGFLDDLTRLFGVPGTGLAGSGLATVGFGLLRDAGYLVVGIALCRLKPWARWAAVLVCGDALFRVAGAGSAGLVSLIIHGYILFLLFSPPGGAVFSASYREAVAATPHLRLRTSLGVKLVAVVVVLLVVTGWMLASGLLLRVG